MLSGLGTKGVLSELFYGGCFEFNRVKQLRKEALTHGLLPDHQLYQMDMVSLVEPTPPPMPWWLPVVALCRAAFKNTAIVVGTGAGARFFRFLFAKSRLGWLPSAL